MVWRNDPQSLEFRAGQQRFLGRISLCHRCRTVEDCAIVFEAIRGADGMDQTVLNAPFNYQSNRDIRKLRIGYLKSAFEEDSTNQQTTQATLDQLQELGWSLIPIELPDLPIYSMSIIL